MGEPWDASFIGTPTNTESVSGGNEEIQDTRKETANRGNTEHAWNSTSIDSEPVDTGRHREGSARAFYEAASPTTLKTADYVPSTSTNPNNGSNALDAGRLWVDSDTKQLFVNTAAGVNWSTVTTVPVSGASSLPVNRFINPLLCVAQERGSSVGTPLTLTSTPQYLVDGWYGRSQLTTVTTPAVIQGSLDTTTVPAFSDFAAIASYIVPHGSIKVSAQTADAGWNDTASTTDRIAIAHPIEGYRIRDFFSRDVIIYFWAYTTQTGNPTYTMFIKNNGNTRYYLDTFQLTTSTWTLVSFTVPWEAYSGSWDVSTGRGALVGVCLAGSSALTAAPDAWGAGDMWLATGSTNTFPLVNTNNFYMTMPVIGVGATAGNYQLTDQGYDVAACQRHYETSMNGSSEYPGQASGGAIYFGSAIYVGQNDNSTAGTPVTDVNTTHRVVIEYRELKRTNPTVTLYDASGGAATGVSVISGNLKGFSAEKSLNATGVLNASNDNRPSMAWVADARLT